MNRNESTPRKEIKIFEFSLDKLFSYRRDSLNLRNYEFVGNAITKSWGQLKYLISEIQFFNYFWSSETHPRPRVVYVSDKDNLFHLDTLMKMFPWFKYTFYLNPGVPVEPTADNLEILPLENFEADLPQLKKDSQNIFLIFNHRMNENSNPEMERMIEEEISPLDPGDFSEEDIFRRNLDIRYRVEKSQSQDQEIPNILEKIRNAISIIDPVKSLINMRFPLNFQPQEEKSEDETHFNFLEGLALRYAHADSYERSFALIPIDGVEERLWNVEEMHKVTYLHNDKMRKYRFAPDGYSAIGDSMFINNKIGLGKNFDGCLLFETVKSYLFKFYPLSVRYTVDLNIIFESIKRILTSLSPDGVNKLIPKTRMSK